MSAALMTQLRTLADLRARKLGLDEFVATALAQFEAAHAHVLAARKTVASEIAASELQIKALGVAQYETTQDKAIAPGVVVKVFTTYEISDVAAADAWTKEKGLCRINRMDEAALLSIAPTMALPFVKKIETPKVQIATQLNAALLVETAEVPA
jgi:hypothetical protein